MKLLREYYELCDGGICQDLLTEEEKRRVAEGAVIMSGVMQMSETQNGNGRVYPHAILEREVSNYMKMVEERQDNGLSKWGRLFCTGLKCDRHGNF